MNRQIFLNRLGELMSLPAGTLQGTEQLETLKNWDSVALMSFIAFLDEELELRVTGRQVIQCRSVADLVALAGEKVT